MPSCVVCSKVQSRLNDGSLCKECYSVNATNNDTTVYPGLSREQIDNLPNLPDNWMNEPVQNLNGGHLLKILLNAHNAVNDKIKKINNTLTSLEVTNSRQDTEIEKLNDTADENGRQLKAQGETISTLKKVILNQQEFLEKLQRDHLAKNVIISGIPNYDMTFRENTLSNTVEKVDAILNVIGVPMEENEYKLITLLAPKSRDTYTVKLIISSAETKRRILQNAKNLKSSDAYKNMYVKNDETKLARSENFRN